MMNKKSALLFFAGLAMVVAGACFALAGGDNIANWAAGVALGFFIGSWITED